MHGRLLSASGTVWSWRRACPGMRGWQEVSGLCRRRLDGVTVITPLLAGLVVTLLALDGSPAWSQASVQPAAASDSRDLLRRAHQAQRHFEQTRRDNLPAELGAAPHRCDER